MMWQEANHKSTAFSPFKASEPNQCFEGRKQKACNDCMVQTTQHWRQKLLAEKTGPTGMQARLHWSYKLEQTTSYACMLDWRAGKVPTNGPSSSNSATWVTSGCSSLAAAKCNAANKRHCLFSSDLWSTLPFVLVSIAFAALCLLKETCVLNLAVSQNIRRWPDWALVAYTLTSRSFQVP